MWAVQAKLLVGSPDKGCSFQVLGATLVHTCMYNLQVYCIYTFILYMHTFCIYTLYINIVWWEQPWCIHASITYMFIAYTHFYKEQPMDCIQK
mgnify:CR=1 FL=1